MIEYWHECNMENLPYAAYGAAVDTCYGEDDGKLWVSNEEYASQVNFCPFCGIEARKRMK